MFQVKVIYLLKKNYDNLNIIYTFKRENILVSEKCGSLFHE